VLLFLCLAISLSIISSSFFHFSANKKISSFSWTNCVYIPHFLKVTVYQVTQYWGQSRYVGILV
jgi:hypothetical protein